MGIIETSHIDFDSLKKIEVQSNESDLFYDRRTIYKIYKHYLNDILINKERKVDLLSESKILPNILTPDNKIYSFDSFIGCSLQRKSDVKTLSEFDGATEIYFKLIRNFSSMLKQIHIDPRKIVLGDVDLSNILIDKDNEIFLVDVDSCGIMYLNNYISPDRMSYFLWNYLENRRFNITLNKSTDKLSLLLCFIQKLFGKNIDFISSYEYDELKEQYETLKNLKQIIIDVQKNNHMIPNVPYLDEIISINDLNVKTKKLGINWLFKRI